MFAADAKTPQNLQFCCRKMEKQWVFLSSSTSCDSEKWESEWNGKLLFSNRTSNSAGVITGISKNIDVDIIKHKTDKNGRIIIIELVHDNERLLLINFYNSCEFDQLNALHALNDVLSNFDLDQNLRPIFAGDMNIIF